MANKRYSINFENQTRKCSNCEQWKSFQEFWKDKNNTTGFFVRCIICENEKRQTQEYKQFRKQYEQTEQFKTYQHNYELTKRKRTEKDKKQRRIRENKRRQTDPLFKLKQNCSRYIRYKLKGNKIQETLKYVGCSLEELKIHLELQFKKDMSWNNYGKWEIDHIYPTSLAKTHEELIKLFHYSNLRPLWKKENQIKSNKI